MSFIWDSLPTGTFILNLILIVVIFAVFGFCVIKISKRRASFIFVAVCFALAIFSFLFNLLWLFILTASLFAAGSFIIFFANIGDLRKFLAAPFKKKIAKNGKFGLEKIFDSHALYNEINSAVASLSKTRTGAIITLEKSISLKDFMKNGTAVNAPVSKELLETIFYPGTRLHDGAVVIHGNVLVSAAVFFTPSTKAFAGKYGSRHRAAIGISEVTDSVTVVVSEETGRISIAYNGELESVSQENFIRVLENYMNFEAD